MLQIHGINNNPSPVYFLDTEFNEGLVNSQAKDYTIDLISIGIKAKDGRSYYAINFDFNWNRANDWVKENIIAKLPPKPSKAEDGYEMGWRTHAQIAHEVQSFLNPEQYGKPEIWGNFNSYDWVTFCWLWGIAVNLPKKFPFYCRELKQECDRLGITRELLPPKDTNKQHHALYDAEWDEQVYDLIQQRDRAHQLQLASLEHEKNNAYHERNMCVALAARMAVSCGLECGRWYHEGEEEGWGWIISIHLPTGWADWHIPDSEIGEFSDLPIIERQWEAYSTKEKYQRVLKARF